MSVPYPLAVLCEERFCVAGTSGGRDLLFLPQRTQRPQGSQRGNIVCSSAAFPAVRREPQGRRAVLVPVLSFFPLLSSLYTTRRRFLVMLTRFSCRRPPDSIRNEFVNVYEYVYVYGDGNPAARSRSRSRSRLFSCCPVRLRLRRARSSVVSVVNPSLPRNHTHPFE